VLVSIGISRRRLLLGAASAAAAEGSAVSAPDADGTLLIRGRRIFLHGLYQLPGCADPLRAAAAAGFHVVHGAGAADLDAAAKLASTDGCA
jgi:hypothetical protein